MFGFLHIKPNNIFHSRKQREAWRLTVLSSALPSECDGEASFTDTLRPHTDYWSRLNPNCLQRLVPMLLCSRHETTYRQSGFLTPAPCMEFEPPRHSPFDMAHGGKECAGANFSAGCKLVATPYIALIRGLHQYNP